tara:strand:- start:1632 stop:2015 length:384 start_codon:yes stop_codon:yes gene_type:complete
MNAKNTKKENDLIAEAYTKVNEDHGDMREDEAEGELGGDPTLSPDEELPETDVDRAKKEINSLLDGIDDLKFLHKISYFIASNTDDGERPDIEPHEDPNDPWGDTPDRYSKGKSRDEEMYGFPGDRG